MYLKSNKLIFFFLFGLLLLPLVSFAQVGITNPIKFDTFPQLFASITSAISLLIGGLGTVMIIIAGILYLLSAGNQNMLSQAKSTLLYAILGMLVGFGANSIIGTITKIKDPGANTPLLIIGRITTELGYIITGLSVVMVIISGIYFLFSFGSPDKMKLAKQSLTYAIMGIIIGILATTIVGFIQSLFA